jgi:hypothetical protein
VLMNWTHKSVDHCEMGRSQVGLIKQKLPSSYSIQVSTTLYNLYEQNRYTTLVKDQIY